MKLNITREITALKRLTTTALRAWFAEVFGAGTPQGNRVWLIKRIAWKLQSLAEGDLSDRARQRAAELANDLEVRLSPPKPRKVCPRRVALPGTVLERKYKGEVLHVRALEQGFEFEGMVYRSLSAVAKAITGAHCSGNLFFGLNQNGGDR